MKLTMVVAMAALLVMAGSAHATSPPPPGAASCSGCHARQVAASGEIPGIFGRDPTEVLAALTSFKDGSKPATVMNRIAKGFSDDELQAIAAWLAAQK
jgi:sulfide dehydrogenase cytochrome subunit